MTEMLTAQQISTLEDRALIELRTPLSRMSCLSFQGSYRAGVYSALVEFIP